MLCFFHNLFNCTLTAFLWKWIEEAPSPREVPDDVYKFGSDGDVGDNFNLTDNNNNAIKSVQS